MGKPEDMMEELATAIATPKKASTLQATPVNMVVQEASGVSGASGASGVSGVSGASRGSVISEASGVYNSEESTPVTTTHHSSLTSSTQLDLATIQRLLGPTPPAIPGKVWVPVWSLQDPPSSFEEKILEKVKGPSNQPAKKRRKVDYKTKVITSQQYLEAIDSRKKLDFQNLETPKENAKDSEEENEEIVEEIEEDEDKEDDDEEVEQRLVKLWKWLGSPTKEEEVVGKWFAFVYQGKKSVHLYIGKATERFLCDQDGPIHSVTIDALKPRVGTGTILESYTGDSRDISLVKPHDIIEGPINVIPQKGNKWEVPKYQIINDFFGCVKGIDRDTLFAIEI